jgi:hypothetical protein
MTNKKRKTNQKKRKSLSKKKRTLGNSEPMHTFFLNPYEDSRFTKCPQCLGKTKIRKRPFGIHIDPNVMMTLNMSGPYCPSCDLIILHKDKVETLLTMTFEMQNPDIIGNDYLIVGTLEQSYWRKASKQGGTYQELFDNLHDFKKVVVFEPMRPVWLPNDQETD